MPFLFENFSRHLGTFPDALEKAVSQVALPSHLDRAVRYAALGGGKFIRPYVILRIGSMMGVSEKELMPAAVAVEMVHSYSLVHDDLPAMDDDDLRRGRATVHRAFDEATAILVGDALLSAAFAVLGGAEDIPALQRLELVKLLAEASGGHGMVGGQMLDVLAEGQEGITEADIAQVQELKTGALFGFCALTPAILAAAPQTTRQALAQFGRDLGTLFQLSDDILGATASDATSGKTAQSDARNDKMNWVRLLGVPACRQRCEELFEKCCQSLETSGVKSDDLEQLLRWIATRQ